MSQIDELVGCTLTDVTFSRFSYRLRFDGRRGNVPHFFDVFASGDLAIAPGARGGMQTLSTAFHPLMEHTIESAQFSGDGLTLRFVGFTGERTEVVLFAGQGSSDSAFEMRVTEASSGELKDWRLVPNC